MPTTPDAHDTNLLAAHLEGRLEQEESTLLVAHLAECGECRATLAAFARASSRHGDRGVGGLASARFSRPAVWLPIAAMLAIGTVAGILTLRLNPPRGANPAAESASSPQAPPIPSAATPSAAPAPSVAAPPAGRAGSGTEDTTLFPKRSAERTVGAKVFRLEAGEWIDASYDRLALLPVVEARTTEERAALLERLPALRPYAALGASVLVVYEGTVYRIGPITAARPSR